MIQPVTVTNSGTSTITSWTVLLFIGAKMLLIDVYKIPVAVSLLVTAALLGTSMLLSGVIPPAARSGTSYPFARKRSEAALKDQSERSSSS